MGGGEGMMGAAVHEGWTGTELNFRRCDLREWSLPEFGVKIENGDGEALIFGIYLIMENGGFLFLLSYSFYERREIF